MATTRESLPEYTAWRAMHQRCNNPKNKNYSRYGGRGIKICDEWLGRGNKRKGHDGFWCFYAFMGKKPSPDHELDRINNNGNYEPGNCRWATKSENSSNRQLSVMITIGEETLCLTQWAKRHGLSASSLRYRIRLGIDPAKALLIPFGTRIKKEEIYLANLRLDAGYGI